MVTSKNRALKRVNDVQNQLKLLMATWTTIDDNDMYNGAIQAPHHFLPLALTSAPAPFSPAQPPQQRLQPPPSMNLPSQQPSNDLELTVGYINLCTNGD